MESLSFFFGVIGNIISVLVFLAPIGTFWRIVKHRSTQDFESLPYVCTLLNSSLWTYYGIIKPGEILVATVNGFGAVVEAVYVTLFLIYAPAKLRVKTAALVSLLDVGFLAAAILVTRLALQGDTRIDALGFICSGLNIVMYGSPLAAMGRLLNCGALQLGVSMFGGFWNRLLKTVVTTKSVEFMPFFLSFFLFLNGGIWTTYAVLVRDYFLAVPNGTGFVLGTAQLVLYAIYRNAKPSDKFSIEDGSQQEQLIASSS